jgi:NADH dehydrogenase [ubiquinone] 1 alpha subcomplex assembly factor 5
LKKRQREWANKQHDVDYYSYLKKEVTERLSDRLDDITRKFPLALEIDGYHDYFHNILKQSKKERDGNVIGGIQSLITLSSLKDNNKLVKKDDTDDLTIHRVFCDNDELPFPPNSFDLIVSPCTMHWINDLPSHLLQIKSMLKPDGAFLGAIVGGKTLEELRNCFYLADMERKGGVGPHASPFTLPSDVAGLMQGAGFSLPTVDVDNIVVIVIKANR